MRKKCLSLFVFVLFAINAYASYLPPSPPANVSGYVVVNGYRVSWLSDNGYAIVVTRDDSTPLDPAVIDDNGLSRENRFLLTIPVGNEGVQKNDTLKLHLYRNDQELSILSPVQGKFIVGGNGSFSQINIIAGSNPPPVSIYTDVTDSDVFNTISLNANKSYFFGDQIASVTWEQTSGPTISLSDIHSESPTFSIPGTVIKDQTLEFKLTLEDYKGQNYSDTFIISATAIKNRIDSSGLPYSENFSSALFKDQTKTTMDWSVTEYKGILLKPAIRQNAFSPDTTIGKEISMLTDNTFSMCVADIDGDGDNDLIVGNKLETNLLYLNNGGAEPFKNVVGTAISNDRFESFSMDTGDIDGDGDIDLIAAGESNPIRIYLNNGTSDPFFGVNGINLSDHSSFTISLKLVDINGDGHLDVISGNIGEESRLYLNNGTPNPFENVQAQLLSPVILTFAIDAADIDNDGDMDIITGNSNNINYIYLNNGTSSPFENVIPIQITFDEHDTYDLAIGDIDNNGYVDLVFANYSQPNRIYLNNGDLTSETNWTAMNLSDDVSNTFAIALHDVDNDGDLDCVCANEGVNRLYINDGSSTPFSSSNRIDITDDAHITNAIVFEDMDNDGDPDIIAGNENQTNRLYINNGFTAGGRAFYSENARSKALAYGDFNNDGHLDLVVANNGINRIYYNDGTTTPFQGVTGQALSLEEYPSYSVAIGDVDGDNDLDIVFANYSGNNRLYLNNGTANPFENAIGLDIGQEMDPTLFVVLIDIDKDNDLDLITGNDGLNRLYLNNGSLNPFYGAMGLPISNDDAITTSLAIGDIDNDGDLDIVAANEGFYAPENRLYLNDGSTTLFSNVEGLNISNDYDNTKEVLLSDIDGDNDLDVIAANENEVNRIYLNNGTDDPFANVSAIDIYSEKNNTKHIILADIDHDGDEDLICSNYGAQNLIYQKNSLTAPFFDEAIPMGATDHQTIAMAVFDADSDGDFDLVEANDARPNIYFANNGNAQSLIVNTQPQPNPYLYIVRGAAVSLEIDDIDTGSIPEAVLTADTTLTPNTWIDFYLSNTGGDQYFKVQPGKNFVFPTSGSDLRWKAQFYTLCPTQSPQINSIQITRDCVEISEIPDQRMPKNSSIDIPVTLTHYVGTLQITTSSSNQNLVPDTQITKSCSDGDCMIHITPYTDLVGTAYINISANDGCKTATDSFRLDVYNQPPVSQSNPIELSCSHDDPVVDIQLVVTDADNDSLSYLQSVMPQHGFVGGTAPNIQYVVQDSSFVGVDCFSYKVSDGMDEIQINICIRINDPLSCFPGTLTLHEDDSNGGRLYCNKTPPINFFTLTPPKKGVVNITNQSEGLFVYDASSDEFGDDIFSFYVKKDTENSAPCPVTVNILPVNDVPSFQKGENITCKSHDNITFRKTNWATNISAGPSNESDQSLFFHVSVSNESFFLTLPQITSDGTLEFKPALNVAGVVDVSVTLQDDGGILYGGVDTSMPQTFQITFEKVFSVLKLLPTWYGEVKLEGTAYRETGIQETFFPGSPFWEKRFDINSEVVMTVTANQKWKFVRYAGSGLPADISPTDSEIHLPMNIDREISAEFVPMYELTIIGQGNGTVNIDNQAYTLNYHQLFVEGQQVQIQAIPGFDYTFGGFSGDVNDQNATIELIINRDLTLTAHYLEMFPLNISGNGRVAVNGIDYDLPFEQKMPQNNDIKILGLPQNQFQEWTGDMVSTENPLVFQMPSARNIVLNLKPFPMKLNAKWNFISIPLLSGDVRPLTEVFPQAVSAFNYQNGAFVRTETIAPQEVYWINNSISQELDIHGEYLHELKRTLTPGWHLIPGLVHSSTITLVPADTNFILYGYKDGKYYPASSIKEGCGYWIKVNQACELIIK